ncbi:MAG: hypothetical protein ACFE0Q_10195 [Anaerolineae bacterium]
MKTRLNGILTSLSQQYAYDLLAQAPDEIDARLLYLADSLAGHGFLVLVADVPVNNFDHMLSAWVDHYRQLYDVLANALFPFFKTFNPGLADGLRPSVVVLNGEAAAVMHVLAGYVVPYVAIRQQTRIISEPEIRGLMTYILEELQADDLSPKQYAQLLDQCGSLIAQLIMIPIRQYSLTILKKPIFQSNQPQKPQLSDTGSRPAPPPTLPETGKLDPTKLKRPVPDRDKDSRTQKMPIWFDDEPDNPTKPQPPVPWKPGPSDTDNDQNGNA